MTPGEGADLSARENGLERICRWSCAAAIVATIVMVVAEVASRALFGFSFQVVDELSGYLLVAIAFLSLPVCARHGAFHEVEFVQRRLSPPARRALHVAFGAVTLAFSAILLWQFVRFDVRTWRSEEVSETILATPLWIPRLVMAVGMAVLLLTIASRLVMQVRGLSGPHRRQGRADVG